MSRRFYFEGFDQHIQLLSMSLNTGSENDLDRYWAGGSPGRHRYTEGFDGGQAYRYFRLQSARRSTVLNPLEGNSSILRYGYWGKRHNEGPVDTRMQEDLEEYSIWTIGRPDHYLHINMKRDTGEVYISWSSSSLSEGSVLAQNGSINIGTSWAYHEIYYDMSTGEFWMNVGGDTIGLTAPSTSGSILTWGIAHTAGIMQLPFGLDIDHLWASKGYPVVAQAGDVVGVAVQALWDRQGSAAAGFRGGLIGANADNIYLSDFVQVTVSQSGTTADRDVANAVNFYFPNSPETGEAWSTAEFGRYRAWGVCWAGNDNQPRPLRLTSLGLMYLQGGVDGPRVRTIAPSGMTFFSGPWQKSDPSLSYIAHVWNHPRIEESTHLIIDGPGCIYFPPEPPAPDQLPTVGVTFAEEFRVDHRDWFNVDGQGISFDSYFVSGFGIYGEGNKKSQSNYINVNYEEEFNGGAYLQACWDYALNPNTGRWSQRQNIYKPYDSNYKHNSRRLKLRGHGKTIQLRVENYGDRPFGINGWTMMVSGNTSL